MTQQWLTYERMRAKIELRHLPKIYKALRYQFFQYADRVQSGEDIFTFIPDDKMAKAVRDLYVRAGVTFAIWQERELRNIKRFNPNDKWVNEINDYFGRNLFNKVVNPISEHSREVVLRIMQEGQREGWGTDKIVSKIRKETVELSRVRAKRIVRTESGRAANLGKWLAANDFKFETNKVWVSAGDRRVRPQPSFSPDAANHILLNEEAAKMDEPFSNGLMFPGDPNGEAKEVINCRCTLIFEAVRDTEGNPIPRRSTYAGMTLQYS